MRCSAGCGLSGAAVVFSGQLSDAVIPSRTSPAAPATRSGVMWFSAPRSSSPPQRPQELSLRKSAANSSVLTRARPTAQLLRPCPGVLHPVRTMRLPGAAAIVRSSDERRVVGMADYDVIIVGTGAGGGTLARRLAPSGKRILLLERGDWLPREPQNWLAQDVFVDNRYVSEDTWYDERGKPFQPQIHYFVGGATKLYGAALYRLRKEDLGDLQHHDGLSPAWPISYDELEPYYTKAEQ